MATPSVLISALLLPWSRSQCGLKIAMSRCWELRLLEGSEVGEEVGGVFFGEGFEEAFGHEGTADEFGAADLGARDAAVIAVGNTEDNRVFVLGDEKTIDEVVVVQFDAEDAVASFHGGVRRQDAAQESFGVHRA